MANIYRFRDYKDYLGAVLDGKPGRGRGERTKLAAAFRCNTTYVSQILAGTAHLSLEQAERGSRYLLHSEAESHYFMLLVQYARAGSPELRKYFSNQIEAAERAANDLKNRLVFQGALDVEAQATYYSAWYYTAIHFLFTIPGYQDVEAVARHLGLKITRVLEVVEFLVRQRIIERDASGLYQAGPISIHLGSDSPMIIQHHTNWRMRSVADLEAGLEPSHLHYSSIITLAAKDAASVKSVLVEAIESVRKIVKPSKNEKLYCYALDFFEVKGIDQS